MRPERCARARSHVWPHERRREESTRTGSALAGLRVASSRRRLGDGCEPAGRRWGAVEASGPARGEHRPSCTLRLRMQVTRRSTATPLTARREPGGAHRSARRHCRPARLAPTDPLGETPGDGRRATGDGRRASRPPRADGRGRAGSRGRADVEGRPGHAEPHRGEHRREHTDAVERQQPPVVQRAAGVSRWRPDRPDGAGTKPRDSGRAVGRPRRSPCRSPPGHHAGTCTPARVSPRGRAPTGRPRARARPP